jgi:hypothetical protein
MACRLARAFGLVTRGAGRWRERDAGGSAARTSAAGSGAKWKGATGPRKRCGAVVAGAAGAAWACGADGMSELLAARARAATAAIAARRGALRYRSSSGVRPGALSRHPTGRHNSGRWPRLNSHQGWTFRHGNPGVQLCPEQSDHTPRILARGSGKPPRGVGDFLDLGNVYGYHPGMGNITVFQGVIYIVVGFLLLGVVIVAGVMLRGVARETLSPGRRARRHGRRRRGDR